MNLSERLFKPYVPNRDLGVFLRRSLGEKLFLFERLEAYALLRIDDDTFMLMSEHQHNDERFNVAIHFSKPQILSIAEGVCDVFPELSLFLLDMYKQPFSFETADFMEVDFPYNATIWITISARLLLEKEDEYRMLGDEFLPFEAVDIIHCETEDFLD